MTPTHVMMRHPRKPDTKNFIVEQTADRGNGAGDYVDEKGAKIVIAHIPGDASSRGDRAGHLEETLPDGTSRLVTIARC